MQEFGKDKNNCYELQNPVNPEAPLMRDDIVYGLLAHTARNSKFFDQFKLFDIGKIRTKTGTWDMGHGERDMGKGASNFASEFVDEQTQLGVMLYQKNIDQWDKDPLLEAKNIVRMIAKELELGNVLFEKTNLAQFHPKKQANIHLA